MIKCEVLFPGKLVTWKNGTFRTPLTILVKDSKEVKEFKTAMKAYGISAKMIKTTKIEKPNYEKKAKETTKAPKVTETKKIVFDKKKPVKSEKSDK